MTKRLVGSMMSGPLLKKFIYIFFIKTTFMILFVILSIDYKNLGAGN